MKKIKKNNEKVKYNEKGKNHKENTFTKRITQRKKSINETQKVR